MDRNLCPEVPSSNHRQPGENPMPSQMAQGMGQCYPQRQQEEGQLPRRLQRSECQC